MKTANLFGFDNSSMIRLVFISDRTRKDRKISSSE
jgi:hypothetical protein